MLGIDYRIGGFPQHYIVDPKKRLMQVPDRVRKCVAFLSYDSPHRGELFVGTAFCIGWRVPQVGIWAYYLVTARHVIENRVEKGIQEIFVRVNTRDGAHTRVRTQADQWLFHETDPAVDVAVTTWGILPSFDMLCFPMEAAALPELIEKEGIGLGNELFMVGLYKRHAGAARNIPIIRVGNIAAMPEEPVQTKRGPMEAYLIEMRSISGISGSPVFVHRQAMKAGDFVISPDNQETFFLLGVMHGRWDVSKIEEIMDEVESNEIKQPLNTGIGVVVPASRIVEILQRERFVRERAELIEVVRKEMETIETS